MSFIPQRVMIYMVAVEGGRITLYQWGPCHMVVGGSGLTDMSSDVESPLTR